MDCHGHIPAADTDTHISSGALEGALHQRGQPSSHVTTKVVVRTQQKGTCLCRHARCHGALGIAGINSTSSEDAFSVLLLVFQQCYGSALGLQPHQPMVPVSSTEAYAV